MPYDNRYDERPTKRERPERGRHAALTPAPGIAVVNGKQHNAAALPPRPPDCRPAIIALIVALGVVIGVVVYLLLWPPVVAPVSSAGGGAVVESSGETVDELGTRFGDVEGWEVGKKIEPGIYVNANPTDRCEWKIVGLGMRASTQGRGYRPAEVKLLQSGATFTSKGCGEWVRR